METEPGSERTKKRGLHVSEKKTGPLADLHKLFDDVRMANIRRGSGEQDARRPTAKTKARREAIKKAWSAAQSWRHLEVACCHKCRRRFPSLTERATHEKPSAEAA